ncbi:MAG: hypothetical protein ACR2N4_07850 [Jatrophihabitans sp.]
MTPSRMALAVLPLLVAVLVWCAAGYLRRYRPPRPPIGVYRWSDIAVMIASVVVAPFGYLALPRIVVAVIFGVVLLFAIQLMLAPICGGRPATAIALVLVGLTGVADLAGHAMLVVAGTDAALFLALIGVANLWAQSGMRAVQVAALAGLLAGYDLLATGLTDMMSRFAHELNGLPYAPVFALTSGPAAVSIGLGDLLMLVLYPLVATRCYGRRAGIIAAAAGVASVGLLDLLFALGTLSTAVPFLTVLGPVIVIQQLYWRRRYPVERPVVNWLNGRDPASSQPAGVPQLTGPLHPAGPINETPGSWLAVIDGRIVGRAGSPGRARRCAREAGYLAIPVVRQV